jgi:hypothetical protein
MYPLSVWLTDVRSIPNSGEKADISRSRRRAKKRHTEVMRGYANTNKKVVAQF